MNTLDDLRDTFDLAAGTPDVHGVVEAAQTRAGQIRRRRRVVAAAVAAGLVVVVAVAVPLTTARLRATEQVATPPPYRTLHQLTLSEQGPGKWFVLNHGTDSTRQFMVIRNRDTDSTDWGGTVSAHDPGTYDPAALEQGENLEVNGHPAHYLEETATVPALLGWRDPSGVWITISGARDRAGLIEVAGIVRLGPPRAATGPVQFGRLPGGLPLNYVASSDESPGAVNGGLSARMGFAAGRPPAPDTDLRPVFGRESGLELSVLTQPKTSNGWKEMVVQPLEHPDKMPVPQWTTIGGQRAWFRADHDPEPRLFADGPGAHLFIETDTCGVLITVADLGKISYDELVATVSAMTFSSCTDVSTWRPVVS
ncbi:MAG: hypothetical protein ABW000_17510 [Actinoplanes sp.]